MLAYYLATVICFLQMISLASSLIGAVVGLVAVSIFAVTLRRIEEKEPKEAVITLIKLISIVLGGGLTDFVVFDVIVQENGLVYYMIGLAVVFLPLGLWVFLDWRRAP